MSLSVTPLSQSFFSPLSNVVELSLLDQKIIGIVALVFAAALYFYWEGSLEGIFPTKYDFDEESIEESSEEISEILDKTEIDECIQQIEEDNFANLDSKIECAKKAGIFLKKIKFESCLITDDELISVMKACPNLELIELIRCENLKDRFFRKLPKDLKKIVVHLCNNVPYKYFVRYNLKKKKDLAVDYFAIKSNLFRSGEAFLWDWKADDLKTSPVVVTAEDYKSTAQKFLDSWIG